MKVFVCVHYRGITVELPDDYKIGKGFWQDLQRDIIRQLEEAAAADKIVPFLTGLNGDELFRQKMEALPNNKRT